MADPNLIARFYLIQGANWHRIGIEVRHALHGVSVCDDVGVKATCDEAALKSAWSAHIDDVVADVRQQYQEWSDKIAREIEAAKPFPFSIGTDVCLTSSKSCTAEPITEAKQVGDRWLFRTSNNFGRSPNHWLAADILKEF